MSFVIKKDIKKDLKSDECNMFGTCDDFVIFLNFILHK